MKHLIDIQTALATREDMEFWEQDAEQAMDTFNTLLHLLYDKADEYIAVEKLENMIQFIWENWREDSFLLDIDEDDLYDWVDQFLATWDDEHP